MNAKAATKGQANSKGGGFSPEEKMAMLTRARELKAEAREQKNRAAGEKALLGAISAMKEPDRSMGLRLHEIVVSAAPGLMPKTWYGMPAYTNHDDKVICFFQASGKFNTRYSTIGFQPDANLDDRNMWATAYALVELTSAEEERIRTLVRKAAQPRARS
ncbi:MAG: hypothetical protein U1F77_00690 [Kiritimatiellia bacterium]